MDVNGQERVAIAAAAPARTGVPEVLCPVGRRRSTLRFVLALAITGLALGLTLAFPAGAIRPYFLLLGAIVVGTWYAGWLPGLLTTLLSGLAAWRFVFRASAGAASDLVRFAGFIALSAFLYSLVAALNRVILALRNSNLRFGGVVQISEDAIMTVDEAQRITLFNPGAERIFGYPAEAMLGKSLHLLLPERYRTMHERHVAAFRSSSDVLRPMNARGVIYGQRADGSEFPAEASISKFEAAGETILTVRLRDISERQAAEERLRQMAAIVEFSQDAIVGEDLSGKIISWNPGAENLYGYTAAEAIGRDARMLLPPGPGDRDEVGDNLRKVQDGTSTTQDTVRLRRDGKTIEVALTVSPIRDQTGAVTGAATIARDIRERKRLEGQLQHAQKMEAVGRLAGGVAHDFNNLLSVIVGYGYLIQSSVPAGDPLRNAADEIMGASERAGSLTRQLLAFSRKQVMRPEVLDLNAILDGIGRMLPRLIGEDIDIHLAPAAGLHRIKVDPGQVEQVIMNLVVNARDAMPNGGRLTVETANVDFGEEEARHHGIRSGSYVLLAVSDTGHGMDNETRARIFEPFFTTKEPGKGTGLGLATVYGIVSQSNGHIWVYSEPGCGTTFKVYFPSTGEAAATAAASARPEPALCGQETVLLVEDESRLRELLIHVLHDRGYKVLAAADGAEALRIAGQQKSPVDLLMTDVVMPGIRGQVLAEELLRKHPGMAVLYMSGYTDNALTHRGNALHGAAFLQKPFTPDQVLRVVRQVLDDNKKRRRTQRRAG
jgi:PAS domain S-box-containing protein